MIHHFVIQSSTIGVLPVEKHSKEEIKTATFKVRSSQTQTIIYSAHMSLVTYHFPNNFFEPELKAWVIGSGDVLYISPTFKDLKQWQMADFLNHLADSPPPLELLQNIRYTPKNTRKISPNKPTNASKMTVFHGKSFQPSIFRYNIRNIHKLYTNMYNIYTVYMYIYVLYNIFLFGTPIFFQIFASPDFDVGVETRAVGSPHVAQPLARIVQRGSPANMTGKNQGISMKVTLTCSDSLKNDGWSY